MSALIQAFEPQLVLFVLVATRVSALFLVLPLLSGEIIPVRLRLALALAVSAALLWVSPTPGMPTGTTAIVLAMLGEAIIGASLGMILRIAFATAESLGMLIGMQMGLGFNALVDPLSQARGPLASIFSMVAWLLFFATNGHHEVIRGLGDSVRAVPPGTALSAVSAPLMGRVVMTAASIFSSAVRIAAPVTAILLASHITVGLIARVAQKVNLMMLSFLITISVGMIVMSVASPSIGRAIARVIEASLQDMRLLAVGR